MKIFRLPGMFNTVSTAQIKMKHVHTSECCIVRKNKLGEICIKTAPDNLNRFAVYLSPVDLKQIQEALDGNS